MVISIIIISCGILEFFTEEGEFVCWCVVVVVVELGLLQYTVYSGAW